MRRAAIDRIYIPSFCGNRKLDKENQVTVELKLATIKEKDQFQKFKYTEDGSLEQDRAEHQALKTKIIKINNYYDEKDHPIDTAEKLIEDEQAGAYESIQLASELFNFIMGFIRDGKSGENTGEISEGEN